mmetsp:Transcript_10187/g.22382  ORF Transcript_10187/g.22382 Transcript_10187/m.22382 type:complete len:600 (+) Transcript_10187:39-1838(+)
MTFSKHFPLGGLAWLWTVFSPQAAEAGGASTSVTELLFMADIGHSRHHQHTLVDPWPMSKSADEGSFSLYEGLLDYVRKRNASGASLPQSVYVLGDVGYCGGDLTCTNETSSALLTYLDGHVPQSQVFPVIGNHDVHYFGCSMAETRILSEAVCHYGTRLEQFIRSAEQMSFHEWRGNWFKAFTGLSDSIILPPPSHAPEQASEWMAPARYNVDPGATSKVYLIAGLVSGSWATTWNGDTPEPHVDAMHPKAQEQNTECRFLEDSIAHGRRLQKTIFIYLTHDIAEGCQDWAVLQQIDLWLYGHKHNAWQSVPHGNSSKQEQRHFPIRMLLGNGGFDEAYIDVVSFVSLKEEHVVDVDSKETRVRLHLDVLDTCRSVPGLCPSTNIPLMGSCWSKCLDVPGGYDGGSGPRAALPNLHGHGFVYEAPFKPRSAQEDFPGDPSMRWKLQFGDESGWIAMLPCSGQTPFQLCVAGVSSAADAATLSFYDTSFAKDGSFHARLAIWGAERAVVSTQVDQWFVQTTHGFWDTHSEGVGLMMPSVDGYEFTFTRDKTKQWRVAGVVRLDTPFLPGGPANVLYVDANSSLPVHFQRADSPEDAIVV